jgi:hypothetical protein
MNKFNKETSLTKWDFMLYRLVDKGYCTIGELNSTITCDDVLRYTEILDFLDDREAERRAREDR